MAERFTDFYLSWNFLHDHRIFKSSDGHSKFQECIREHVFKVNPGTNVVSSDPKKNTATRVQIECGPWIEPDQGTSIGRLFALLASASHDPDLDCVDRNRDEVIIVLANKVFQKYGV